LYGSYWTAMWLVVEGVEEVIFSF